MPTVTENVTIEQLKAQLAAAQQENAALKAAATSALTCKISEKGAISVTGLQRWPVTLYQEQWQRVSEFMPHILAFIKANQGKLAVKGQEYISPDASPLTDAEFNQLRKRDDLTPTEEARMNTYLANKAKK